MVKNGTLEPVSRYFLYSYALTLKSVHPVRGSNNLDINLIAAADRDVLIELKH